MDFIATPIELENATNGRLKAATVRKHAREGKLKHAERTCSGWLVNATREWPALGLERK